MSANQRRTWIALWAAHALAALAWWWLMPSGFPCLHFRWWSNTALPLTVVAVALLGLLAFSKPLPALAAPLSLVLPVSWATAAVTARMLYPISMSGAWLFVLAVAAGLGVCAGRVWRRCPGRLLPAVGVCLTAAAMAGVWVRAQQAEEPATQPLNHPLPVFAADHGDPPELVVLTNTVEVVPATATVHLRCGRLNVEVQPLLTFRSRSPDRCWTLLSPRTERIGPARTLAAWHATPEPAVHLRYQDDATSVLEVRSEQGSGAVLIDAHCLLPRPVYSHLNAWCLVTVTGHEDLALAFSPCPETSVAVVPYGDPAGRPLRLAYVDAAGVFHVAEASRREKGPFKDLASGPLAAAGPLTITLLDRARPTCRLVFDDWSPQTSRALSPTAGWGLPENALEFCLREDSPRSAGQVLVCLAATSVGRGFDSVGHAAGTYRNRMRLEPVR